jgi:hypothetical protein
MRLFRFLLFAFCLVLAATTFAQTLTCSSDDMGRHYCRANTSDGVRLVYQRSGSACTMGVSWGYDNNGIWVDRGCRADFELGSSGGGGPSQSSPNDAMRLCRNTASQRLPNVPLAYIGVYRATDADARTYMINFRAQPPGGRPSSGFCAVSKSGQLRNFQFDANSGNSGGNNYGGISPNDAMRLCKDASSARMPSVPLAYIRVYRGTDPDPNTFMIDFRAQPPNQGNASGFCIISKNGKLRDLQFDSHSGRYNGGGNPGGQSPQEIMRACKNAVSVRMPNVPLAYIQVNQPRVNGGSMLSTFRTRPPNGPYTSGSCDVFKNGHVNLQFDR